MMRALLLIFAVLALAAASPAVGQDRVTWTSDIRPGTVSSLELTRHPEDRWAWALIFANEMVHHGSNDQIELAMAGDTVRLRLVWQTTPDGAETVEITALPDGWECHPCAMTVDEMQTGMLTIYPTVGNIM